MKLIPLTTAIFALGFSSLIQAKQIDFEISGIKHDKGLLFVQLFKGAESYKNNKPVSQTAIKAEKGKVTVTFDDLAPGEYALRYFHDENGNAKLETNLFGMPQEGYGFSNNAQPDFGPAKYPQVKFLLSEQQEKVKNQSVVIY